MAATLRLTAAEAEAMSPSRLMSRQVRRPLLLAVAKKAGLTSSESKGVGTRLLRRKIVDALASSDGQIPSKAGRVRVTSGSADPAKVSAEGIDNSLLLDRNGNSLKGTARQARIDKLRRESPEGILDKKEAKASETAKAEPTAKADDKAPSLDEKVDYLANHVALLAKAVAALAVGKTS